MQKTRKSLAIRILVLVAMVVSVLALSSAAKSDTADAYCSPWHGSIWQSYGAESYRYWGTCDGDGIYAGKVLDRVTDGFCASAEFRPDHESYQNTSGWLVQGYSCTTGAWSNYNYYGVWVTYFGSTYIETAAEVRVCAYGTGICSFPKFHQGA